MSVVLITYTLSLSSTEADVRLSCDEIVATGKKLACEHRVFSIVSARDDSVSIFRSKLGRAIG